MDLPGCFRKKHCLCKWDFWEASPFQLFGARTEFFFLIQVKACIHASMALHEAHKLIFLNPRQSYLGESSLLQGGPIQSELTPSAGQITTQLFSLLDPAVLGNAWAELDWWSLSFMFLPSQHMGKVQGGAGHSLLCRIIWDLFRAVMQLCWSVSDFSWAPSLRLSLH